MPGRSHRPKLHTGIVAAVLTVLVLAATAWLSSYSGIPARPAAATPSVPGQIVVVGLGDSVTSGAACDCTPFTQLYAAQLPKHDGGPAVAVNLGENGQTSAGLLKELSGNDHITDQVRAAGTVLLTIGANDLTPQFQAYEDEGCDAACYQPAVDADGRRITQIIQRIKQLRGGAHTLILVTGYWNVFPDGTPGEEDGGRAYLAWSNQITQALNRQIEAATDATHVIYVDIYAPFKGNGSHDPTSLLAPDGDHPNAAGHKAIAAMLLAATPSGR